MSKRLLVVSNEPKLLARTAAILRDEGYDVVTVRSGRDALIHIARSIPDLVICTVRMPVMDGYSIARHLHSASHTSLIPIIGVSSRNNEEERVESYRSGMDAFVARSASSEELLSIVGSILDRVDRVRSAIASLVGFAESKEVTQVRDPVLTDAEWRIAEMISRGLSNKEIAAALKISVRTVESHVARILAKKNFRSRVEIARSILVPAQNPPRRERKAK